jgi:hypothetical protein
VETKKNQELTQLIGRRMREACDTDLHTELPFAIAGRLADLREAEAQARPLNRAAARGGPLLDGD